MLTEQEVIAHINSKTELKPGTKRLIDKLKLLETAMKEKDAVLEELRRQTKANENDLFRLRGATSVLIELIAEEEGLISNPA
jgi:hypothetical protein